MRNRALLILIGLLAGVIIAGGLLLYRESKNLEYVRSLVEDLKRESASLEIRISAVQGKYSSNTTLSGVTAIDVIARVSPAIVRIDTKTAGGGLSGSGTIIDGRGYVLTNYHVIDGATSIKVTLHGGSAFDVTVVKSDKNRDIALLKLNSSRTDFPIANLSTLEDTIVGEDVLAIGFPLGTDLPGDATVTRGIVSAIRMYQGYKYVQHDAAINHGISGGALVDLEGKMIGVLSYGIETVVGDVELIGLAIPVDEVRLFVQNELK